METDTDCEHCVRYWNSDESKSVEQKAWIPNKIYRIGPVLDDAIVETHSDELPTQPPHVDRMHCVKVEQSDSVTERAFTSFPELRDTGYNNIITCKRNPTIDCPYLGFEP